MDLTQLEKLKSRLSVDDVNLEPKLLQVLEDAESAILDYTNRNVLIESMKGLHRDLAIIYYNRLGSEGETSRSEGGVSVSYITDIPNEIKSRLNSYRLAKAAKIANAN